MLVLWSCLLLFAYFICPFESLLIHAPVSSRLPHSISAPTTISTSRPTRHTPPCVGRREFKTATALYANNNNNNNNSTTEFEFKFDGTVLTGDVLAIIVACQLIGLIDVLNDSHFWDQGGFAQAIPAVPSTLGTFVQRVSASCIAWIVASLGLSNTVDTAVMTAASTAQVVAAFVALQLAFAYAASGGATANTDWEPLLVVARDCYIITIVVAGWRYFYKQFYDPS